MLIALIADRAPDGAAVEEVFVNANPQSTLKLGQARAWWDLRGGARGARRREYAARLVKKAVVGMGNAEKSRSTRWSRRLLPGVKIDGPDAADALAVASSATPTISRGARRLP